MVTTMRDRAATSVDGPIEALSEAWDREPDEICAALTQACEAVSWLLESWPEGDDPGPGIRTDLVRWQALVAAAQEPQP